MSWRNLRSISTDPLSNFLSKLSQDQILREAKEESEIAANLEQDKYIGQSLHSICEIRSFPTPFIKLVDPDQDYYTPLEPDKNRCRFWVKFDSGANTMHDYSYFGARVRNVGYPLPVQITSTSYDEGIVGGQNAIQYNDTIDMPKGAKAQFGTEAAYVFVDNAPSTRLGSYLDGETITGYDAFCISMLVRPKYIYNDTSVAGVEGWNRRLCMGIDQVPVVYGYEVRITPGGALAVIFRDNGVDYAISVNGFFALSGLADFDPDDFNVDDYDTGGGFLPGTPLSNIDNFWYRIDIIYKFSDHSIKVRKNGVNQTTIAFPLAPNWITSTTTDYVDYYGGPYFNRVTPQIHMIFWGEFWLSGIGATRRTALINAVNTICGSDYYKGLKQYGEIKGPFLASTVVNTAVPLSIIVDQVSVQNVFDVIENSYLAGLVPHPDNNISLPNMGTLANANLRDIYVVIAPPPYLIFENGNGAHYGLFRTFTATNAGFTAMSLRWQDLLSSMCRTYTHESISCLSTPVSGLPDTNPDGERGWRFKLVGAPVPVPGDTLIQQGNSTSTLIPSGVTVQRYWSDVDGKNIAPGTGDTWHTAPHPAGLFINAGPFSIGFADRPRGVGINEFADFRIYAGELTQTESTNLYTNKYSISSIPGTNSGFGHVAINDYCIQPEESLAEGEAP